VNKPELEFDKMSSQKIPAKRRAAMSPREVSALDPELRQLLGPPPLYEGESEAD
jgi:hypothetical protein